MGEPIACLDAGLGPPLVLVHGGFSDGRMAWSTQLRTLPSRFRLLVVDRRGHGASPRAPGGFTIAGDADDVRGAADRAGVRSFHVAGHSYGALVAIEMARRWPERIAALHLVEPPYLTLLPEHPDVQRLAERTREMATRAAERGAEATAASFFSLILSGDELAELRARKAWLDIVREAGRMALEEFVGDYPAAAARALRLDVPVRVYTGGLSHPGLRALAGATADAIAGATLVDVADVGHVVQRSLAFDREVSATAGEPKPPLTR